MTDDSISRAALMELFDWWEHEYVEIDSYIRNMRQDVLTLPTTDEMVRWWHGRLPKKRTRLAPSAKSMYVTSASIDIGGIYER